MTPPNLQPSDSQHGNNSSIYHTTMSSQLNGGNSDDVNSNGHGDVIGHGNGSGGGKGTGGKSQLEGRSKINCPNKDDDKEPSPLTPTETTPPSPRKMQIRSALSSSSLSCIRSGLASKASPTTIKSWIALSLTLDGRDKITKVLQYSSRLLGFYFESISSSILRQHASVPVEMLSVVAMYRAKAKRFRNLQKALTTSRKAYRLGRTVTEVDKLRSMGLVHWIAWYLTQMILRNDADSGSCGDMVISPNNAKEVPLRQENTIRWHPDTKSVEKESTSKKDRDADITEEDRACTSFTNSVTHHGQEQGPPSIQLPHRVSSNLSPTTVMHVHLHTQPHNKDQKQIRQLSTIRRFLYSSLSCYIDETKIPQLTTSNGASSSSPPPLWKIISSSFKLLGLAGFWAGDNISYLYSTGFLTQEGGGTTPLNRRSRAKAASIFAARSYFFAAVCGLYLNIREWNRHRNGPLQRAMEDLETLKRDYEGLEKDENVALKEHEYDVELKRLEGLLEKVKRAHAKICIALLKSCCDTIVFSNNQGIDLHLKYRGKKMNEGIQCVCGITSALTVLYNNFPNKK